MDFACGSSIQLENSEKIGNKVIVVYGYHSVRSKHASASLCIEIPILPGLNLCKEIYSDYRTTEIDFRKVDDKHIEFETSRGTPRTVAI